MNIEKLKAAAAAGNLLTEDQLVELGFEKINRLAGTGLAEYIKAAVTIYFYGGELSEIEIDGENIETLAEFAIKPSESSFSELCFSCHPEALKLAYQKAGIL